MAAHVPTRVTHGPVTLVEGVDGAVRYGFTERGGGVSPAPYESLNLGSHVGDDPANVAENRRRALAALGAGDLVDRLIVPNQVHGDEVVTLTSSDPASIERARSQAAAGADAVVCTAPGVPVMLCFADCAPVILTLGDAFAVAHSGWRGTLAGIAGTTALALARAVGGDAADIRAYIGPHILGDEYEVSEELVSTFSERFDDPAPAGPRLLDLSACIRQSLERAGVPAANVVDTALSTISLPERFYSYRGSGGACGRHAAVAVAL